MRSIYACLLYVLTPFFLLHLVRRSLRAPAYRRRWSERFAFYRGPSPAPVDCWLHAVSVGEAEAAFPLIHALKARHPDWRLLVTTTTPTGSERVKTVLGDSVLHVYLPYDLPDCVRRFLRRFRPRLAIVMETEIWPTLYAHCGRGAVPLFLVNARLSDKSARRYRLLRPLVAETLSPVTCIAAQTRHDADRFIALGAEPGRVAVTGNIKFDQPLPPGLAETSAALRQALFPGRTVWIAASTHEGEESLVVDVYAGLKARHPSLLLVLVPRHPERFDGVAKLCRSRSLAVVRRSEQRACNAESDVFLVDTMGELRLFYAAADAALVGGSLVPTGGHNMLEAAAVGLPVLFGPHTFNFAAIASRLVDAGAAIPVADRKAFAAALEMLLEDEAKRRRMGEAGRHFVESNRGALDRTIERIEQACAQRVEFR